MTLLTAPSVTNPALTKMASKTLGLLDLLPRKHVGQKIHALDVAAPPSDILSRHRFHTGSLYRPVERVELTYRHDDRRCHFI